MPHIHDICRGVLRQPLQPGGPPLLHYELLDAALFTAKEAIVGFVLGARDRLRARRRSSPTRACSQRGLLPYIVASQTVPILAIAPMVVVGLGSKGVEPAGSRSRSSPRTSPSSRSRSTRCAGCTRPTRARSS